MGRDLPENKEKLNHREELAEFNLLVIECRPDRGPIALHARVCVCVDLGVSQQVS